MKVLICGDGHTVWKMDFSGRTLEQKLGAFTIEDERIVRYVLNHDEQVDQVRRVLELNHLDESEARARPLGGEPLEGLEGIDAPDGMALAMQQLIELTMPPVDPFKTLVLLKISGEYVRKKACWKIHPLNAA